MANTKQQLAEGFHCECGEYHKFPAYVYAHWGEVLIHTCPNCGQKRNIIHGIASKVNDE